MGWGLVLGGGGALGAAWAVGALNALAEQTGRDPRDAELVVGTSAGSMLAALLGCGVSAEQLYAHQLGEHGRSGPLAELTWDYDSATGGARALRPKVGPGSAALVTHNVRRLRELPATAVLAALMPEGRGSLHAVGRLVHDLVALTGRGDWCDHPGVRVVALDYTSGERVVFGGPHAPGAALADAVMASCAIPGWFHPVQIGGRRYVDGGVWSSTNVDVLAGAGLDDVVVIAPTVCFAADRPVDWRDRVARRWRERATRRCVRESWTVRGGGTEVTVLGPGPEDLAVMGPNLMDVRRRREVLRTSRRTSAAALADPAELEPPASLSYPDLSAPDEADPADEAREMSGQDVDDTPGWTG